MCLFMNLLSSDEFSFRRNAPNKALKPLAKSGIIVIVKNIVSQALEAVWTLEALQVVYTIASTSFIQVWIIAPETLYCKVYLLALLS